MALPSEIGLYFDFEVTDDGIPYGCPGFEIFDSVHFNWTQYRGCMYIYIISGRGRKSSEHKYMHNFRAGQKKCGCKYTHCLGSLEYLIYKMCINL